jgi:hypothetical protein
VDNMYPQDLSNLMVVGQLRLDCQTIFPPAGCSYKWLATETVVWLTGGSRAGIRGGFIGGRLQTINFLADFSSNRFLCRSFGANDR